MVRMRASTCDVASRTSFDSGGDEDGRESVLRDQAEGATHGAAHRGHRGMGCLGGGGMDVKILSRGVNTERQDTNRSTELGSEGLFQLRCNDARTTTSFVLLLIFYYSITHKMWKLHVSVFKAALFIINTK